MEVGVDAELRRVASSVSHFGCVQQGLRRDAPDVKTGAANLVLLDEHDRHAEFNAANCCRVAGAAAAEDNQVKGVLSH